MILAFGVVGIGALLAWRQTVGRTDDAGSPAPTPTAEVIATASPTATPTPVPAPTPNPTPGPTPVPYSGWVDPASSGQLWAAQTEGLLTFRGNPTRSYYGRGPVPAGPSVQWRYPQGSTMCGPTSVGGEVSQWCGTGWTGQPAVFERGGRTWLAFGAYDHAVHFVDADTGEDIIPPYLTGDLIKGSVTIDPDGYPIVYSGSRDNYFHVIAIDGAEPVELWRLSASLATGTKWNDDWDGSALVIDDYLFEGGENSIFHIVKLNRGYDAQGKVTVDPELVFQAPGYDSELLAAVGDNVSIENSVAISGNTVYFANSGGLVQGWDIGGLKDGVAPERVFRYWVGDDVDASIVIDDEGMLYVGVEYEQGRARSREIGQIVKLDPGNVDDPLVWSVFDTGRIPAGAWATPAIYRDLVIAPVDTGRVFGIDRATGEVRWEVPMPGAFNWSSPVIVDDVWLQGDCEGILHAFDLSDTTVKPPQLWSITLPGCIESTPAVWDGHVYVGTRAGQLYMLAD